MKKFLAILLLPIYLLSINGILVSKHFCSGKLAMVTAFVEKISCCCEKEAEKETKKNNCCSDTKEFVKLKVEQESKTKFEIGSHFYKATKENQVDFGMRSCQTFAPAKEKIRCTYIYSNTSPPLYRLFCCSKKCDNDDKA